MPALQNAIAIVYDYDQTLSPSYMQDEVVFPTLGLTPQIFGNAAPIWCANTITTPSSLT